MATASEKRAICAERDRRKLFQGEETMFYSLFQRVSSKMPQNKILHSCLVSS